MLGFSPLASCSRPPQKAEPPKTAMVTPAAPPLALAPPPSVDRAQLLAAVAQAASAFAVGQPEPKVAADLAGRRFSIKTAFGCFGPQVHVATGYLYDDVKGTLKVSAQPEQWIDVAAIKGLLASPDSEAIEGFWIRRPWIVTDACPVTPGVVPAVSDPSEDLATQEPGAGNTVGLAAVFDKGGSRVLRRGSRPYEVVRKSEEPSKGGFRLVLEGRLVAAPGGRSVSCWTVSPDQRPTCIVRVEFDRVAIESATGDLIGEWSS
jgi:hypothetical protein